MTPRILSITVGDEVGTWNVHYSDGSTELADEWTDEMATWYNGTQHRRDS